MARQIRSLGAANARKSRNAPPSRRLYEALRDAILEGRLRPGTRVSSTRELAEQQSLARGTVVSVFEQMKAEGYLEGSVGSGTFVSKVLPEELLQVQAAAQPKDESARRISQCKVTAYARRLKLFPGYTNRPIRAFRPNLPAVDLFPTTLWAQLASCRLRRASVLQWIACEPLGHLPLRQAVSDYLNSSRGVRCSVEHVAIVTGMQEALDLAARILLEPGDTVCMERPGFPGAARVFRACGASIRSLEVDEEGLQVRQLPKSGARLVYVTPAHQFPLGTTMSLARRLELLEWARKTKSVVFEDDYDSEFRYTGKPVPSLQGLDRNAQVLFAGSFSKVLFPALRLGYLVLPPQLLPYFEAAKSLTSRHAPVLEQAILAEFIAQGHFGRHIRRMREVYADRLSTLLKCAKTELGGLLEISPIEAGLQTVGWLPEKIRSENAEQAASRLGVEVISLNRYGGVRGPREALQLGFAALRPREIERGVRQLALALGGLSPVRR